MLQTDNQQETLYFRVGIVLNQQGVNESTLSIIPMRSIGYKSGLSSVTLTNHLKNMVEQRLKGLENIEIVLIGTDEASLIDEFGVPSADFLTLVNPKKSKALK
jgi:hypothetical protein